VNSGGFESWRIALILSGLAIALTGVFAFALPIRPPSSKPDLGMGVLAVVGLLMVLTGLVGSTASASSRDVAGYAGNLALIEFVVFPVVLWLAKVPTGWKIILAAWCVASVAASFWIARRRLRA
jgi:hypothetical protein